MQGLIRHATQIWAAELVALNVDVIIAPNTKAATAARSKSTTIPIIVVGVADPVGSGLASLGRPGGNITGLATMANPATALCVKSSQDG